MPLVDPITRASPALGILAIPCRSQDEVFHLRLSAREGVELAQRCSAAGRAGLEHAGTRRFQRVDDLADLYPQLRRPGVDRFDGEIGRKPLALLVSDAVAEHRRDVGRHDPITATRSEARVRRDEPFEDGGRAAEEGERHHLHDVLADLYRDCANDGMREHPPHEIFAGGRSASRDGLQRRERADRSSVLAQHHWSSSSWT